MVSGCSWWCLAVPGGVWLLMMMAITDELVAADFGGVWLLTMIAVTDELVAADFGGVWFLMMAVSC